MSRLVSPLFAGRDAELAVLLDAYADARGGHRRVVLIGGEAGGGKSRLVRELVARVRDSARVWQGGCLELSAPGLPYAPFVAGLRDLVRELGPDELAGLVGEHAVPELARLLPAFGPPAVTSDPDLARARLFEVILSLVERLAEQTPLVLVVEDLHWADTATRDLLTFLTASLGDARVLIVATYRADERHPLRPLLAELGRLDGVTAIGLTRLTREAVAAQLEGMLGRPPDPAVVRAVHDRGEGVPLFTESLMTDDGAVRDDLPGSLTQLLLGVVSELPAPVMAVVHAAAVGGPHVGHDLLARVCALGSLTETLQSVSDAHVLVGDGEGYAFRHQLIRAAVDESLLPGERARLHRAYAEALEDDPSLRPDGWLAVEVALHWRGAGDAERALAAAWAAAGEASARCAYSEMSRMLVQVDDLWTAAPAAARATGVDRAEVLEKAADAACWAIETERGLALVERALTELGHAAAPERVAALLLERASLRQQAMLPGEIDDLWEAARVAAKPSLVRAEALGQLARTLVLRDQCAEALPLVTEMQELAEVLDAPTYAVEARIALARIYAREGRGVHPDLADSMLRAREVGAAGLETIAYAAMVEAREAAGDHEAAITAGEEGMARTTRLGLARYGAAPLAQGLAQALTSAGRWEEAIGVIDAALALDPTVLARAQLLLGRGQIAIARGDLEAGRHVAADVRSLPGDCTPVQLPLAHLDLELAVATGDVERAVTLAGSVPDLVAAATPHHAWPLLCAALRAAVDAVDQDVVQALSAATAQVPALGPVAAAHSLTCAAEVSRSVGGPAGWESVLTAWSDLRRPFPTAYAAFRAAAASAAAGDMDAAADRVREAAAIADGLGAEPLLDQINLLARRARVVLDQGGRAHGLATRTPYQLTPRELEVLQLVAAGRSNGEIASDLFISAKTASVHVSNILAKLGVSSRGQAAATAHRLHLFDPA